MRSIRGHSWTQTDFILADLYDLKADSVKWEQPPPRYPRPTDRKAKPRRSHEEVGAVFRKIRERRKQVNDGSR